MTAIYCPLMLMIAKAHPENFRGDARADRYCIQEACQWWIDNSDNNTYYSGRCSVKDIALTLDRIQTTDFRRLATDKHKGGDA